MKKSFIAYTAGCYQYEWCKETCDTNGEILDHDFADKAKNLFPLDGGDLVLIRVKESPFEKSWAYVKDGTLPTHFTDALDREVAKVPKRFHEELRKNYS